MIWAFLIVGFILICFAGVIFVGAPYLPTLSPQVLSALELADLRPGQTLLELGCGDGKVLVAAAQKGIKVVGYELNPILALLAWIRIRKFGSNAKVIWGDYWRADWPKAEAIFVFLLPKYMSKLHNKCVQYSHKPIKLVSFAFEINEMKAKRQKKGVYLYTYNK